VLTPEEQERRRKLKEAEEAERDERTVFASNLPIRASESDLNEFFGKVGKVRDVSFSFPPLPSFPPLFQDPSLWNTLTHG